MRNPSNAPVRKITSELRAMRRSVAKLDQSIRRLGPILRAAARNSGASGERGLRRRLNLSPKQRAALKLQGRYMGFIRQLSARRKAEVRRIRERRGVEAAVKKAMQFVRG